MVNRVWKDNTKERIRISNENVKKGLPADEWVLNYRAKNNAIKAAWKAKKPKKEPKKKVGSCTSFKKGQIPHNKKSEQERAESLKRWREGSKKWQQDNRERMNELHRLRKLDPSNKIKANLRKRLSHLLRQSIVKKTEGTMDLLGCTIGEFKDYLSSLFKDGMTFENYGKWHLDHKKPCYYFDLTILEHRMECFHYTNIQPMWAIDNLRKNKKLEYT